MGALDVTCGITFVTQSCVVKTDLRQRRHCLECYRMKHEAIVVHDQMIALPPSPSRTPPCMKLCEVYRMQSDSLAGTSVLLMSASRWSDSDDGRICCVGGTSV